MITPCILFLDFDGVLHPAGSRRNVGDLAQLPLLENLLREPAYAAVRIVISSTWREAYPLQRLRALFSADIRARVVGVTPELDEYDSDHNRYVKRYTRSTSRCDLKKFAFRRRQR